VDSKTLVLLSLVGFLAYLGWKALGAQKSSKDSMPATMPAPVTSPVTANDTLNWWDRNYQNPGGGAPGFGLGAINLCAVHPILCAPLSPLE
jgi:hypothetical protein